METSYKEKYEQALAHAREIHRNEEEKRSDMEWLFPELKESEDEKVRKALLEMVHDTNDYELWVDYNVRKEEALDWLERQGEHANFRNKIQVGDKVTRNEDGVLVNLTQLKRVAKPRERQGEQKPADKVESHFHVEKGKWYMCIKNNVGITKGNAYYGISDGYIIDDNGRKYNCNNWAVFQGYLRLWDITIDAKPGDVLATKAGGIFIYKELLYDKPFAYCGVDKFGVFKDCNCGNGLDWTPYLSNVTPATKEQRELLFQKMEEAGYEWDAEKKELKKIEQKTEGNKGNIGGISANSKWSEEDESILQGIWDEILANKHDVKECEWKTYDKFLNWLKSLKERIGGKV